MPVYMQCPNNMMTSRSSGNKFLLAALVLLVSLLAQSVVVTAQSFSGGDPKGVRCVSDCQCEYVVGSTGKCSCAPDDGTVPEDCPFDDPSIVDPGTLPDDDDDDGGKGKGKGTTSGKGKRRELTTSSGKKSGDDDDDSPASPPALPPTDRGEVDITFGAFCCDCECVRKPCACECFGYGNRNDRGGVDDGDDDDDGGKGKGGKGSSTKKRGRRRRLLEKDPAEQEQDDSTHVRSRMSRGYQAEATTADATGSGWKSWVYNSIWTNNADPAAAAKPEGVDATTVERQLTTRQQTLLKRKKKTTPGDDDDDSNGSPTPPTPAPRSPTFPPALPPSDRGDVCERPPYTCTYVKFHPGSATCRSRNFCKANTFGYCEMGPPPRD